MKDKRFVIMCGSGGVGKTTVSAGAALHLALSGKKVMAITIDPAKRLADILNIPDSGNRVTEVRFHDPRKGREGGSGTLRGMILDPGATFDEMVRRVSGRSETAENIFKNRYYRMIVNNVPGVIEYMACEKLLEFGRSGEYDAIVVDTPPSKNIGDFLFAPSRMRNALRRSVLSYLLIPYRKIPSYLKTLTSPLAEKGFMALKELIGSSVLQELSELFLLFTDLYDSIEERAREEEALLRSDFTSFFIVVNPTRESITEGLGFLREITGFGFPFRGFIMNRVSEFYNEREENIELIEEVLLDILKKGNYIRNVRERKDLPSRRAGVTLDLIIRSILSQKRLVSELYEISGTEILSLPELKGNITSLEEVEKIALSLSGQDFSQRLP